MKPWTAEEIAYLDDYWGVRTIPKIASNLGRTVNAVKLKAKRLGLGRHIHSSTYITLNQLAVAIKCHYNTVRNWEKYGLPTKRRRSINRYYKVIDIEDFWKWADEHKPLIHFDRIEPLILGAEPGWVAEARRAAFMGKTTRAKWTDFEDKKLVFMLDQYKYSIGEIAAALKRSESAVKRRIYDLRLRQRPVRQSNREWAEHEIDTLLDMFERGYSFEQIGTQLGRSGSAVRGKYEQIHNPQYKRQYNQGELNRTCAGVDWRKQG